MSTRPIRKVLVANRGEIALRVIRACKELGLATVAVYSDADANSPHVEAADQAVCIGPPPATESYLSVSKLLEAARATGADSVHPGYGFLSENPEFARAVEREGLVFIGPPAPVIHALGDKTQARARMAEAGVPIVPGCQDGDLVAGAAKIGFPVLVKAAAGGGGKGMRVVREAAELPRALEAASREAEAAFGDGRVFIERYVDRPRHVEFQILADAHGHAVHLHERDCSLQRRHQKVVEESPSPALDDALRQRMAAAALTVARTSGYVNAGTVEFLLDGDGRFYFLEVNARLQVEHPVTEMVLGLDLVAWQLRIAAGERLAVGLDSIAPRGHAIEVRLYAEDPSAGFLPSPGPVLALRAPAGPGIRWDSGIRQGSIVGPFYDPMLAKLIAHGADREAARARLIAALDETRILGLRHNLSFLRRLVAGEAFASGKVHTGLIEAGDVARQEAPGEAVAAALAAAATVTVHRDEAGAGRSRAGFRAYAYASPWASGTSLRLADGRGDARSARADGTGGTSRGGRASTDGGSPEGGGPVTQDLDPGGAERGTGTAGSAGNGTGAGRQRAGANGDPQSDADRSKRKGAAR